MTWKNSAVKRAQIAAIAAVGVPAIAALGSSLNWRVEGLSHLRFEGAGRRPIMAFWHGRVLTATYYFRNRAIDVPEAATDEMIEAKRLEVEEALLALEGRAAALLAESRPSAGSGRPERQAEGRIPSPDSRSPNP